MCPIKTRYSDLAPGSIFQMAFVLLGCILTREETAGRGSEERHESPSRGPSFEASSLHHLPRCTFKTLGLLSSWFKSQRKENVTFKYIYDGNASSLRRRRGRENWLLLEPPNCSQFLQLNCLEGKKEIKREKRKRIRHAFLPSLF